MVKRKIKEGICPNCNKKIYRRRSIKIKKIKPTKCGHCGFLIENPYQIFAPT